MTSHADPDSRADRPGTEADPARAAAGEAAMMPQRAGCALSVMAGKPWVREVRQEVLGALWAEAVEQREWEAQWDALPVPTAAEYAQAWAEWKATPYVPSPEEVRYVEMVTEDRRLRDRYRDKVRAAPKDPAAFPEYRAALLREWEADPEVIAFKAQYPEEPDTIAEHIEMWRRLAIEEAEETGLLQGGWIDLATRRRSRMSKA